MPGGRTYTPEEVEARRTALLVAVDDPNLLDLLTRVFERRGFVVATAATARQAVATLEGDRTFDAVVAGWRAPGLEAYRWVLKNRVAMRGQFVFLAEDVDADFERVVGARCLALRPAEIEEVVRVVEAMARRGQRSRRISEADALWLDQDRPTLLLADDDAFLLRAMAQVLRDLGFRVTAVESGNAAIAQLEDDDFDVILAAWHMADGSGADLHRWILTAKPWIVERLVFLTMGNVEEVERAAPGVPVLPKGQDSAALLQLLTSIARVSRGQAPQA